MDPTYIEHSLLMAKAGIARRIGASQAAKYGAVGVMVSSLASNIDDYPHTGALIQ